MIEREYSGISVVIPVFNNAKTLVELHDRLVSVVTTVFKCYEIIIIDDGSTDQSFEIAEGLSKSDFNVKIIKFLHNYGQSAAIKAGIDFALNEYVVIMDADLQDCPEHIPLLMDSLKENKTEMAIAKWTSRCEDPCRLLLSRAFYFFSQSLTTLSYEQNLGIFRVIKREALDKLAEYESRRGTILSKMYWLEIPYSCVELNRDPRKHGLSGYSFTKLIDLALYRLYSYPKYPLKFLFSLGTSLIISSFIFRWISTSSERLIRVLFASGVGFTITGVYGSFIKENFKNKEKTPVYEIDFLVNTARGEK